MVTKRNGKVVPYDGNKVISAVMRAGCDSERIALEIEQDVAQWKGKTVHVEFIQDFIEQRLMALAPSVAKRFILYREERAKRRMKPDKNWLGEFIFFAKYARSVGGRRETWDECVNRVMGMHFEKAPRHKELIEEAFEAVRQKQILPSMRSLQFAGPAIFQHEARMYNCSYTLVDREAVFGEIFYLLLCGCGVGFSVQPCHVSKLPKLKHSDKKHVTHKTVEDNIEGWADSIAWLIGSYVEGFYVEFSYSRIRGEGTPLRTSGGKAPGHFPLKRCHEAVRSVLDKAQGRQLTPLECHDIICHIAEAVLAGGIRRSSLISIFDPSDEEMMTCKAPENFEFGGKNNQRQMANNSALFLRDSASRAQFMKLCDLNRRSYGDPGFFFSDDVNFGCNPCGEIGLHPVTARGDTGFGFCNLTEINMATCDSPEEFYRRCKLASRIGTLQAGYTSFRYLQDESSEIAEEDALLGVSLTGVTDCPFELTEDVLRHGVDEVIDENLRMAEELDINAAKRLTTIKPSGTASLLLGGVGSGMHASHAKRYLRRVTMNPNETVAKVFAKANPHAIEVKPNGDLCCVFPCASDGLVVNDETAQEQFRRAMFLYQNWVLPGSLVGGTHNVSCTIVVGADEWNALFDLIWENRHSVAAMSFIPKSSDKGIPFMPREEVLPEDESYYCELIRKWRHPDYSLAGDDVGFTQECGGANCEI